MTPLHDIEAMLAKCTPGDWAVVFNGNSLLSVAATEACKCIALPKSIEHGRDAYRWEGSPQIGSDDHANFEMIARAPSLLRELIERVRAMESEKVHIINHASNHAKYMERRVVVMEKVVEAAKSLDALWGYAQVNIGPTELRVNKALAEYRALTDERKEGK